MRHLKFSNSVLLIAGSLVLGFPDPVPGPSPSGAQPQISTAKQKHRRTGGAISVLDPYKIPKYGIGLVIPGVMKHNEEGRNRYDIAIREFKQQILPGGQWCDYGLNCAAIDSAHGDRGYPATTVWSYGPQDDPVPTVAPDLRWNAKGRRDRPISQFNYPAFTMETIAHKKVHVKWVNELVEINHRNGRPYRIGDPRREHLRHLLPVDQTLHWANPSQECFFYADKGGPGPRRRVYRTDCAGRDPEPYEGPVPLVTHVHGSHVDPSSDGYPEAWWLPKYSNTQYNEIGRPFATKGKFFDDATGENPGDLGYARFEYRNDQAATTLWFHDHSLGITRLNVYAGPAAFWLIRGGPYGQVFKGGRHRGDDRGKKRRAILPGPAPKAGQSAAALNIGRLRDEIREIPILIQDRTFLKNGELFYPGNRAFFETLNHPGSKEGKSQFAIKKLKKLNKKCPDENENCRITVPGSDEFTNRIGALKTRGRGSFPLAPPSEASPVTNHPKDLFVGSMMPPIWNTEAFFNTMVVNGVVWPKLEVAPAQYRFRFLNGANARTLNMSLLVLDKAKGMTCETAVAALWDAKTSEPMKPGPDERSIFQIGSDGGFLQKVVEIQTGKTASLPGNGRAGKFKTTPYAIQGLLMAPAERADTIVDFSDLEDGTELCLVNTAPDSPFGGFGKGDPPADPKLTGQVMKFIVNSDLLVPRDSRTTSPHRLRPAFKPKLRKTNNDVVTISLNERASDFPIAWKNTCTDGPMYGAECASDIDCSPRGGSCIKDPDVHCTADDECRAGDTCELPYHCGMDVPLVMTSTDDMTTGNFGVCAIAECNYTDLQAQQPNSISRIFALPPSGFEMQNPCQNRSPKYPYETSDPFATINILGLTVQDIPTGMDACTQYNRCALGDRHGHPCSMDADCNPNAIGTCKNDASMECKADTDCRFPGTCQFPDHGRHDIKSLCVLAAPYGPMVDLLGTVKTDTNGDAQGVPLRWTDDSGISKQVPVTMQNGTRMRVGVSENPAFGAVQEWEIFNFTPDAHPIHIHLIQFNVFDREKIPGYEKCEVGNFSDTCYDAKLEHKVYPQEEGWKDTVIAHPGQITKVRAKFDIEGLYVWHCHILEHEDNEMMRPFVVQDREDHDEDSDSDSDSDSDENDNDRYRDRRKENRRR